MAQTSTAGDIVTDSAGAVNLTLEAAQASFRRHLRAANRAPRTTQTYLDAQDHFGRFLATAGLRLDVGLIRPEHVEAWLVHLQDGGRRAASVANRYRSLQQFFRWLADEEEIAESPRAHMKPPAVPVQPPPVLSEEQLRRLLKACEGDHHSPGVWGSDWGSAWDADMRFPADLDLIPPGPRAMSGPGVRLPATDPRAA